MQVKARKIMPCLDLKDGQVVKGVQFKNIKTMGDPLDLARKYQAAGADALAMLDISKSQDGHAFYLDLISRVKDQLEIPLTVGGGIASLADIDLVLGAGADRVSIASAALARPDLIREAAQQFGSDRIVLALDVGKDPASGKYYAYSQGGSQKTDLEALAAIQNFSELGAGSFLVTDISLDGSRRGFDLNFFKLAEKLTDRPFIASGGAGSIEDFVKLFQETSVEYGLAASIFHMGLVDIGDLKKALKAAGVAVNSNLGG